MQNYLSGPFNLLTFELCFLSKLALAFLKFRRNICGKDAKDKILATFGYMCKKPECQTLIFVINVRQVAFVYL
jgi:hypothetical protein